MSLTARPVRSLGLGSGGLLSNRRAALLKLGAAQEGILRHHRVLPDGSLRDSVVFSIFAAEWAAIRAALEKRVEQRV